MDIKIGSPYIFRSSIYGDTAVHVTAIHQDVVHFTIDGGEASRQVRDFPELADGTYFTVAKRLFKKPARVKNTIREVPGVGKVAIITTDQVLPTGGILKLETLTLSQLKARAKETGMSTGTKLNRKADLIAAIRAFEAQKVETF